MNNNKPAWFKVQEARKNAALEHERQEALRYRRTIHAALSVTEQRTTDPCQDGYLLDEVRNILKAALYD